MVKKKANLKKEHHNTSIELEKNVLKAFSLSPNKLLNYKQVSKKLNIIEAEKKEEVVEIIKKLSSQNLLKEVYKGRYRFIPQKDFIIGRVDMTNSGSAYIVSEDMDADIYVPLRNINRALHGDIVSVYVYRKTRKNKLEGEIVEIIKRAKTQFIGRFSIQENFGLVISNNKPKYPDILIPKEKFNGVKDGEKVIAKIIKWEDFAKNPNGEIVRILSKYGDNDVEMFSILVEYGLPYDFPEEVEREAKAINTTISREEIEKRRDFRHVPTFTIDPHDAKDFDDALSLRELENGNIELGIHIADVSHYVIPNSLIDSEGYKRSTSVYLVDRVSPMLPEILSNFICSLVPNEEKLTFSAVFELSPDADIKNQWFGRTVILSNRRFTYEEAQQIIKTGKGDWSKELLCLNDFAKKLKKKRMAKGAISFDRAEPKFELDEKHNPIGIYFKEMKDSNHLIEEFMLLANKKVTEFISLKKDGSKTGKTFIYRIHDDPDLDKLNALKQFAGQLGYDIQTQNRKTITKSLNQLLSNVKGKPEANMIEILVMRSMSKAKYSTKNIGHYGLAINYYTHFTSPIRRYPDIMVHRLLQDYLDGKSHPPSLPYEAKCIHSSEREKLASEAERDSIKYMQVKYMEKFIGQVFAGSISGLVEWGMYVELEESKVEGLVHLQSMRKDRFIYDEKNYCIKGLYSKKVYQIGNSVMVRIAKVNLEKKQLDFELIPESN